MIAQIIKSVFLVIAITLFVGVFIFFLGWSGYSPALKGFSDSIQASITYPDDELANLQKRELELIKEIENQKILEAIKEQQSILEEQQLALNERENSINALAASLEEEKNNFLKEKELVEQTKVTDETYQQKVGELANTFISMPPERAVERLVATGDDLLIIDVLKKIDENAAAEGLTSITPFYYSLMEPGDASRILKKSTVSF